MQNMLGLGHLGLGLLVGGIVLVAVLAIVYVLFVHKVVMEKCKARKNRNAQNERDFQKGKGMASEVFRDMQVDSEVKKIDESERGDRIAQMMGSLPSSSQRDGDAPSFDKPQSPTGFDVASKQASQIQQEQPQPKKKK